MAITFDSETQVHEKLHFGKAPVITFQVIHNLPGLVEVKILLLF